VPEDGQIGHGAQPSEEQRQLDRLQQQPKDEEAEECASAGDRGEMLAQVQA
jgi:hypothetical protein